MKRSAPVLLAALLAALPASAQVQFRRDPTAVEQVGALLVDAKGNRVVADSLRQSEFIVVCKTSDRDPAARSFTDRLARFYDDHPDRARLEVVMLDAHSTRAELLRQLAEAGSRWYGIDPATAEAQALLARLKEAAVPALLVLAKEGAVVEGFDEKGRPRPAEDVLRALDKRLQQATLTPAQRREQSEAEAAAERKQLAGRLRANPASASDDDIRRLYPVDGVIKVKGVANAMINQKVVKVGTVLDNGAKVVAIEGNTVTIELGTRRIELRPEPISGGKAGSAAP